MNTIMPFKKSLIIIIQNDSYVKDNLQDEDYIVIILSKII